MNKAIVLFIFFLLLNIVLILCYHLSKGLFYLHNSLYLKGTHVYYINNKNYMNK